MPVHLLNCCCIQTTLFKQAIELGATALNDLTDKVSHLLAVEPGSAKFKVRVHVPPRQSETHPPQCALENKIPIMHPSWITESHDIWLRGDEFDYDEVRCPAPLTAPD